MLTWDVGFLGFGSEPTIPSYMQKEHYMMRVASASSIVALYYDLLNEMEGFYRSPQHSKRG